MTLDDIRANTLRALNRLAKWRMTFASWQLGTRTKEDGECNALREHREGSIIMRAEVNAVTQLLLKKRVFTETEFNEQVVEEAAHLQKRFEELFPGFKAEDNGMVLDVPVANETIKRMHFPP